MDEAAQRNLKFRFIQLTLLLNAIVIFIAIAVLLYFKVPSLAGRAGMAVLLAAAVGLFLYFTRLYRRTKQWLDAEHRKNAEKSPGEEEAGAGDGGERTE
jgi:O-antigen/teichoic acid export membrane protein